MVERSPERPARMGRYARSMKSILQFLKDLAACRDEIARACANPTMGPVGRLPLHGFRARTEPMPSNERLMRLIASRANARARQCGMRGVPISWKEIRMRWESYGHGKCWLCTRPATTADHIIPVVRGAVHTATAIAPACRLCNEMRGRKTPEEYARDIWGMSLLALLMFARVVGPDVFHAVRRHRSLARRRWRWRKYAKRRRAW